MNNLAKEFWFLPPLSNRDQPEGAQGVLKALINLTQVKGFASHRQALEIQKQVWNNTCSQQICILVEGDRCMKKNATKYIQDLDWSQSSWGARCKRGWGGETLHGGVTLELNFQLKDFGPKGMLCWRKESLVG